MHDPFWVKATMGENRLSDVHIRAWIRAGERFEGRADGGGLYLRYRAADSVPVWRFRYRFGTVPRVVILGDYGSLSLSDARKEARRMAAQVVLGIDPAGEKKARKRTALAKIEADRLRITVGQLADDYFERMVMGRWKHPNIVRSRIEKDIKPNIGRLFVEDVKPAHIDELLKAVLKRGAPTVANDVLRWLRRMFDFAVKRHMVPYNPAAAFDLSDAGGKEEARGDRGREAPHPTWLRQATFSRKGRRRRADIPRVTNSALRSVAAVDRDGGAELGADDFAPVAHDPEPGRTWALWELNRHARQLRRERFCALARLRLPLHALRRLEGGRDAEEGGPRARRLARHLVAERDQPQARRPRQHSIGGEGRADLRDGCGAGRRWGSVGDGHVEVLSWCSVSGLCCSANAER